MPSQASRTFPWLSVVLLAIGTMAGSPVAGPGKARIIGAILLFAALGSAFLK